MTMKLTRVLLCHELNTALKYPYCASLRLCACYARLPPFHFPLHCLLENAGWPWRPAGQGARDSGDWRRWGGSVAPWLYHCRLPEPVAQAPVPLHSKSRWMAEVGQWRRWINIYVHHVVLVLDIVYLKDWLADRAKLMWFFSKS